jgi:peptidyl-prolyl cis-trans isomerase A (cyclophilin A)
MLKTLAAIAAASAICTVAVLAQSPAPRRAPAHASDVLPPVPLPAEPGTYAVIYTSMGNIVCRLFPQEAPKAVANFVGLASGTKAWKDPRTGQSRKTSLYAGTSFHRVIPGFMIQGGDPAGDGTGDPGYQFEDEINPSRVFDHPGILAMANHGKDTNGCQFFLTVAPAPHLNGGYTVFGEVVSGQDVADAISKVDRDDNDKPKIPVKIIRITIRKVANPVNPGSTSHPS